MQNLQQTLKLSFYNSNTFFALRDQIALAIELNVEEQFCAFCEICVK